MPYRNASDILPETLLAEIQKYVQGEQLYIPNTGERAAWGTRNGTRKMLAERDSQIRRMKAGGASVTQLADDFGLSIERIRKIVYCGTASGRRPVQQR